MDPIQLPTQEPIQSLTEINVPQLKPNYLIIIISSIMGVILLVSIIFLFLQNKQLKNEAQITNFKECGAVKGALVRESYPAVCVLPSGKSFIQELNDKKNLI